MSGKRTVLGRRLTAGRHFKPLLRQFFVGLDHRATTPLDIVCIGDSITEGQQASDVGHRWVELLANYLGATYDASHTTGHYYPTMFGVTFTNPANPWTRGGSPAATLDTGYGLGRRSIDMFAGTTASITFTGTGFRLFYTVGPTLGTFTYAVDGGAPVSVNTTAGSLAGSHTVTVTGLSLTSHTVALAVTSSPAGCIIEGIGIFDANDASGIRLWEGGHGGYKSSDYVDGANPHWIDVITTIQPQLVLIMLGTNDYSLHSVTVANFKTNLATIIANVRAACTAAPAIIVHMAYQSHVPSFVEPWSDYVDGAQAVAVADGKIVFFSHVASFGGYIDPPGGGLINADRVHPSDSGYALIATNIEGVLAYP